MAQMKMSKGGMRAYLLIFGIIMLFNELWIGLLCLSIFVLSVLFDKKKDFDEYSNQISLKSFDWSLHQ